LLLLPVFLFSCTREEIDVNPPNSRGNGSATEKEIIFQMVVPHDAAQKPQTRSIGEKDENMISALTVLAFRVENNKETYDYSSVGQKSKDNADGSASQKFNVTVKLKEYPQRFVIIANAQTEVSVLIGEPAWKGVEKNVMLANLEVALNAGDKWNTISASNYRTFPMWGESTPEVIVSTTSGLKNPISLLRMIAKINVKLDESVTGLTNSFKMKNVRLYNTNTKGRIVPDPKTITANKATAPTIPNSVADYSKRHLGPIVYSDFNAPGKPDVAMLGAIYTFETASVAKDKATEATCLVIGGIYENDATETYYRVNIVEDDSITFRNILRNHQYIIKIVAVKARGYATPEEAFKSKAVNMIVNILDWDEGGLKDIVFDGQYFLSVNKRTFEFTREARTTADTDNRLLILTDYPGGWTIDKLITTTPEGTTPASWIKPDRYAGTNPGKANDQVSMLIEANNSGSTRNAYITIRAGRLQYKITVTQTVSSKISVDIVDKNNDPVNELLFHAIKTNRPAAQTFTVRWIPTDIPAVVTVAQYNGKPVFSFSPDNNPGDNAYNVITSGQLTSANGELTFTIRPPAFTAADFVNNPFPEKVAQLTFSVSNGTETKTKTLFVRQTCNNIVCTVNEKYMMDGISHSFNIRSNVPWTATLTGNNGSKDDVIVPFSPVQGAGNTGAGENVSFRTVDDMINQLIIEGTATVRITPQTSGAFDPFDVILNCVSKLPVTANCYLVTPESGPFDIKVSHIVRAMGPKPAASADPGFLGNDWLSNAKITANKYKVQVMWSDVNSFGSQGSVVQSAVLSGTNMYDAKITVTPGRAAGNALIILYEEVGSTPGYQSSDGDIIKWSWHIWSTQAKAAIEAGAKEASWMMDRNLGAMNQLADKSVSVDRQATGFYYQWGRKDPYPRMDVATCYEKPLYYNSGIEAADKFNYAAKGTPGLGVAVNKPTNLLNTTDWFGTAPNNNLWGKGSGTPPSYVEKSTNKSVYDPCPVGWKVADMTYWSPTPSSVLSGGKIYIAGSYFPFNYDTRGSTASMVTPRGGPPGPGPGGGDGDQKGEPGNSTYGGSYWFADPGTTNTGIRLIVEYTTPSSKTVAVISGMKRGAALGIRCVKESK
jgi:hypothetical protein